MVAAKQGTHFYTRRTRNALVTSPDVDKAGRLGLNRASTSLGRHLRQSERIGSVLFSSRGNRDQVHGGGSVARGMRPGRTRTDAFAHPQRGQPQLRQASVLQNGLRAGSSPRSHPGGGRPKSPSTQWLLDALNDEMTNSESPCWESMQDGQQSVGCCKTRHSCDRLLGLWGGCRASHLPEGFTSAPESDRATGTSQAALLEYGGYCCSEGI